MIAPLKQVVKEVKEHLSLLKNIIFLPKVGVGEMQTKGQKLVNSQRMGY